MSSHRRIARASQRGVTLIELMVGFTIAILLTVAAVAFAAHETRLMGISRERLDLAQASRAAIDLLAADLKQAGAGIGYRSDGRFEGLLLDNFIVGGIQFNPSGPGPNPFDTPLGTGPGAFSSANIAEVGERETVGPAYNAITTDVGILTANGSYATIAEFNPAGSGKFCRHPDTRFRSGEVVVFRSESSFDAFAAVLNPGSDVPCSTSNGHDCVNGCTSFTFTPDSTFQTDPSAQSRSYLGGEIGGAVKHIVWFVNADGEQGTLRRAVFDDRTGCLARDQTCGGEVVEGVEAFLVQAWAFNAQAGVWRNAGQQRVPVQDRIRVDVEIVIRSRKSAPRETMPVTLNLLPGPVNCVPPVSGCNTPRDYGQRRVIRTSVEIKNSGRMTLQ